MARTKWGRDTGRNTKRAAGASSHQLPSHRGFENSSLSRLPRRFWPIRLDGDCLTGVVCKEEKRYPDVLQPVHPYPDVPIQSSTGRPYPDVLSQGSSRCVLIPKPQTLNPKHQTPNPKPLPPNPRPHTINPKPHTHTPNTQP